MDRKRLLGVLGPLILVCGVFSPVLQVPVLGDISYFLCGRGDGTLLLALVFVSLFCSFSGRYRALWYTGFGGGAVVLFTLLKTVRMLSGLNPDHGQPYGLSWGWAILVMGVGTILAGAVFKEKVVRPETA